MCEVKSEMFSVAAVARTHQCKRVLDRVLQSVFTSHSLMTAGHFKKESCNQHYHSPTMNPFQTGCLRTGTALVLVNWQHTLYKYSLNQIQEMHCKNT